VVAGYNPENVDVSVTGPCLRQMLELFCDCVVSSGGEKNLNNRKRGGS